MATWYHSPVPKRFRGAGELHVCAGCLCFCTSAAELAAHEKVCTLAHPPGDEIYRDVLDAAGERELSVFEVDGYLQQRYTQQLGYIAKMFLESKCLTHDLTCFLFYIMGEWDESGFHLFGYFSK